VVAIGHPQIKGLPVSESGEKQTEEEEKLQKKELGEV
jgi:hypothetical protein